MLNTIKLSDYPLYSKKPTLIQSLTGKNLEEITLDEIMKGNIGNPDLRISSRTLELQAQLAAQDGKNSLAENFRRAAELCNIPDQKVLEIYEALRPNRSCKEDLEAVASELENIYSASLNAKLIREAIAAYESRGLLKKL